LQLATTAATQHKSNTKMEASNEHEDDLMLLEKAQALVEVEQALTATLEKVEPWLLVNATTNIDPNRPRVRPIPTTMEQVRSILAVARNLGSRTSAPAAWNPAAPVVGFSTPNPMPHQLRGGALAALQLERARQAERDRKRQRVQEEEKEKTKKVASAQQHHQQQQHDPKRGEARGEQHRRAARGAGETHVRRTAQQQQLASMNLSDSSSSEDDSE
jgi:hypothetical protein